MTKLRSLATTKNVLVTTLALIVMSSVIVTRGVAADDRQGNGDDERFAIGCGVICLTPICKRRSVCPT